MLDKNEGHSGIDRKVLQESGKRLQPSRGSAYRDDGERGRREQIIRCGVPHNGAVAILRTRYRRIFPVGRIHRGFGRVVGTKGAPRRLFGFSHDGLDSCESRKRLCTLIKPVDYVPLWSTASIEASCRDAGVHPEVRLAFEVASPRDRI